MGTSDNSTIAHKRDASVDAFRCLLMFLIVLHHAAFHGFWKDDTSNWMLPLFFTTLIYWHVDGFIAISGWYGVRFSLAKFFSIWGVIAFWSAAKLIVLLFAGIPIHSPMQIWSGGWFGDTYMAFRFVVPIINAAIEKVMESGRKTLYLVWAIFNIGMILNWTPYHMFSGVSASGGGAFSILTFIYVYINVRFVRLLQFDKLFSHKIFFLGAGVFLLGVACFSLPYSVVAYVRRGVISQGDWIGQTGYNSPHSVLMAIALLLFFVKKVKVPDLLAKCIVKIAPLMFGVYIIHEGTGIGRKLFTIPQAWMAGHASLSPLIIVFISAIITFWVAICMESIRRIMVAPLRRKLIPMLKQVDARLGMTIQK